ncbi:MAG: hypothetical protein AAFZ74_17275 [Pseudomonadota bacterium]
MKKIQKIGFDPLIPILRRVWTTEELLSTAGGGSEAIVKLMQARKLISPGKVRFPNGKLTRVWSLEDVVLVSTVLLMSEHTGFSLSASVAVAAAFGRDWLQSSTDAEKASKEFWRQWKKVEELKQKKVKLSDLRQIHLTLDSTLNILVSDRYYFYKSGAEQSPEYVGQLLNATSNKPSVKWSRGERRDFDAELSLLSLSCPSLSSEFWSRFGVSAAIRLEANPSAGQIV